MGLITKLTIALLSATSLLAAAGSAAAYTYIDECGPTWQSLPVPYFIDEAGTNQFEDIAEIESNIVASFESWTEPCCADFESEYLGLIDPEELGADAPIITFHDDDWPASYGGPDTLAVTMVLIDEACHIVEAPIHFNTAHHHFVDGDELPLEDGAADLQAVAAHEVGHLLGLGHSQFLEATMYSAYLGGTEPRHLHVDDVDGLCSLYPTECACTDDDDCRPGEVCEEGFCTVLSCSGDEDCEFPFLCHEGNCTHQSCTADEDCPEGLVCHSDRCLTSCPACRPCSDHTDCGHNGYCRVFAHGGRCMITCTSDGKCPGDSVCTEVQQGQETFSMCTAPGSSDDGDYCPEDYLCDDDVGEFEPCPGLGLSCSNQNFECSPDNDVCIELDDRLLCSCTCSDDADCGGDHRCVEMGEQWACLPALSSECSRDIDCSDEQLCVHGECVDDESHNAPPDSSCSSTSGDPTSLVVMWIIVAIAARFRPIWQRRTSVLTID